MKLENLLNPVNPPTKSGRSSSSDSASSPQIGRQDITTSTTHHSDLYYSRVPKACTHCRREKSRCDLQRPCHNCVKRNRAEECVDGCHPCRKSKKVCDNMRPCLGCIDSRIACADHVVSLPSAKEQDDRKKSGKPKKKPKKSCGRGSRVGSVPISSRTYRGESANVLSPAHLQAKKPGCTKLPNKCSRRSPESPPIHSETPKYETDGPTQSTVLLHPSSTYGSDTGEDNPLLSPVVTPTLCTVGTADSYRPLPYPYPSRRLYIPGTSSFNPPSFGVGFFPFDYTSVGITRDVSGSAVSATITDQTIMLSVSTSSIRSTHMF